MKELTFEEALEQLENIVNELEKENLTLDESVKKFEKGMELSKYCNGLLESAEKDISILIEQANRRCTRRKICFTKERIEGRKHNGKYMEQLYFIYTFNNMVASTNNKVSYRYSNK